MQLPLNEFPDNRKKYLQASEGIFLNLTYEI